MRSFEDVLEGARGRVVSLGEVKEMAESLSMSTRSLSAKLRAAGVEVDSKKSTYTEADANTIKQMAQAGNYIEEIAEKLGKSVKSIRGKLLSMQITGVKQKNKKAPKKSTYTAVEEDTIKQMAKAGNYLEEIATKLGRPVNSIRGKLLSMKITGVKQKNKKEPKKPVYTEEVIAQITKLYKSGKTEDEIATALNINKSGLHRKLVNIGLIQKKAKQKFWTDDKVEKLKEIAENESDLSAIASQMDIAPLVVAKELKSLNIDYSN